MMQMAVHVRENVMLRKWLIKFRSCVGNWLDSPTQLYRLMQFSSEDIAANLWVEAQIKNEKEKRR